MLEVRMIERNWSETIPFNAVPVTTVVPTREVLPFARGRMSLDRESSIPLAFMHPPKHMAQMIRYTVFSIPSIPLEETRESTSGFPVEMLTEL